MKRSAIGSVGVFVLTLLVLSSATPGFAQGRGRGRGQTKVQEPAAKTKSSRVAQPLFGSHDREVISNYYARRSGLPPGLAKRDGDLPPGLEKQLRRNGTLPPGLRKKLTPFPADLERQLGPLPSGYRRAILDRHMLVYRTGNYTISDLFRDAVR